MRTQLKWRQAGYSLIEAMVTAGLLGVTSLYSVKLMEERSLQENNIKTIAEINRTVHIIQKVLNSNDACTGALAGKVIGSNLLKFAQPDGAGGEKIYLETDPINGKIYDYFFIPPNGIQLQAMPGMSAGFYQIQVTFKIKGRSFLSKKGTAAADYPHDIIKNIPLIGRVDGLNAITSCESDMSDSTVAAKEKFCQSLGVESGAVLPGTMVTWNAVTEKCEFKGITCPNNQVPTQITTNGTPVCVDLTQQLDLYEMIDTDPKNCVGKSTFSIGIVGNKFTIICP